MEDLKLKQQVVAKIKESANILVTVSNDPSVDALTAALGLTLIFDKLGKYGTAIFSGAVPPAISFLAPEKTFDNTTDSLRDFIIALNKEKADHLRYKVDGDVVKIFITPYKTTISSDDLEFSQGDYNVELVIALGVDNADHLDKALENHGQIFHDATVVTMTVGDQTSTLGGIDWHDPNSGSLSEMVAGLAEDLKVDEKTSLIDAPVATALLTGIVAHTDRFSNEHTSSRVMTLAAQLMGAGADQQLIATKLEESHEIASPPTTQDAASGTGGLSISHGDESLADLDARVRMPEAPAVSDGASGAPSVGSAYALDDTATPAESSPAVTPEPSSESVVAPAEDPEAPAIAGHSYISETPSAAYALDADQASTAAVVQPEGFPGTPPVAPGSIGVNEVPEAQATPAAGSAYAFDAPATPGPTDLGLPLPPPLPDFSAGAPLPPAIPIDQTAPQPERLGDILAPEPQLQPQPQPIVSSQAPTVTAAALPSADNSAAAPADPAQFKIPGQP